MPKEYLKILYYSMDQREGARQFLEFKFLPPDQICRSGIYPDPYAVNDPTPFLVTQYHSVSFLLYCPYKAIFLGANPIREFAPFMLAATNHIPTRAVQSYKKFALKLSFRVSR